jgi:hypothetical protein
MASGIHPEPAADGPVYCSTPSAIRDGDAQAEAKYSLRGGAPFQTIVRGGIMPPRRFFAVVLMACSTLGSAQLKPAGDLRIVVIAGEGAVNIIQQKTAVAPIIEVRDRNNLPVSGATVTFSVSGTGATFGSGSTLTVVTNAAGQATAAGLTPTAAGALQVNVTAAFQGQLATAAVTQTNFVTAQAAAAAGAGGGTGASGAAGAGAGAGGGGIGLGTIGLIGGAVAGGAVAATQTELFGKKDGGFITIRGEVFATVRFGGECSVPAGGNGSSIPRDCYGPAVSGALVSTTLDSVTTTTDGAGHFDLVTTVPEKEGECRTFTMTITAAGHPTYTLNGPGFASSNSSHRQRIALSPPTPSFIQCPQ